MTRDDYNQLNDIVEFYGKIEKLYENLAEYEIQGKENSSLYNATIANIEMIRDITEKKFQSVNIDSDDIIDYEENLAALNHINDGDDCIINLLELKNDNKVPRMCMKLYNYSQENHIFFLEEEIDEEFREQGLLEEDELQELKEDAKETLINLFEKEDELEDIKDKLFAHTLMSYLINSIASEEDNEVRDELIRVKYRLIFVVSYLEQEFLKNPDNFTNTREYQKLATLKLREDKELFENHYTVSIVEAAKMELEYLSGLQEEYYHNTKNKARALLRSLYIKACLSINYSKKDNEDLIMVGTDLAKYCESVTSREYINNTFKLLEKLNCPKK